MSGQLQPNIFIRRDHERNRGDIPHIFIFTDVGKDIDDLVALLFLAQLHKNGRIKIVGVITSLQPARKRALLLRRVLEEMEISPEDLPVAFGTDATDNENEHEEESYEFEYCQDLLNHNVPIWNDMNNGDHIDFAAGVLQNAAENNKKIRFLILTSLQDVNAITQANRTIFDKVVSEVHVQGGLKKDEQGKWVPDSADAQNMRFCEKSTVAFWNILSKNATSLSWAVYTKYAATKCEIYNEDFATQSERMKIVGAYMQAVEKAQNSQYFRNSLIHQPTPNVEDVEWFIRIRTTLAGTHQLPSVDPNIPKEEFIRRLWNFVEPYAKTVPYDPIAALGCISDFFDDDILVLQEFALDNTGTKFLVGGSEFRDGSVEWRNRFASEKISLTLRSYLCEALGSQVSQRTNS